MATKNELIKAKAIARAWSDPIFKARLIADPRSVLMEMGMESLEGKEVKVFEDTEDRIHNVIENSGEEPASEA